MRPEQLSKSGPMIHDEDLQRLVDRFYARVREDELIGPIFNSAIGDWPEHLRKLGALLVVGDELLRPLQGQSDGGPFAPCAIDRAAHVRALA